VVRVLTLFMVLILSVGTAAAQVQGPLQAQNSLAEIAYNGTQATALANLGSVAHVPTTTALEALYPRYIAAGAVVVKDGWDVAGDMPAAEYTLVASPCPVNTYPGGGDGGAYFPAAYNPGVPGGECWEIAAQQSYDARVWDVPYTDLDPKNTNGTQLTAMLTYVGNLAPGSGIPQPVANINGPVLVDSTVTAPGAFLYIPNMSLVAGPGLVPSGGVCPAVFALTTTGTHYITGNIDVNRVPGVNGVVDEVNGTNHLSFQINHWEGICGSVTATGASATSGSQIIAVASATGLADGMVARGNASIGLPDLSVIVDVPDSTTCTAQVSAAACVVVSKPMTASFSSASLVFDNDANGLVCGGGYNCGGTFTGNYFEWLNNDPEVGQAAYRYGRSFWCAGGSAVNTSCNDIAITQALIQEGVASFEEGPNASAHLKGIEFNNDNYGVSYKGSATFSGTAMTVTGTIGVPLVGDSVAGNGLLSAPSTPGSPTIISGTFPNYVLSASQTITGPITVTTSTPGFAEVNSPFALLDAGANVLDLQAGVQTNGSSLQAYVTRATGIQSGAPLIIINADKATASGKVTLTPNALVQLYTDQPTTNFSQTTIDPFTVLLGAIGAPWAQFGPGTIGQGQAPNDFDLYGAVLDNFLYNQEAYTTSASLTINDCGQSITTNNNSAGITLTVPDSITNVGPSSSCYYWIYTQGTYPVTVAATSAATFNNVPGPILLAQNTSYLIKTTGIPGSALNWSVSPPILQGNTPVSMTNATGTTIGQLTIVKGTVTRSNCAAALTDTTATAAQIENALPAGYDFVGGGPPTYFRDINNCSYTVTIAGGTGVNTSGTMTIAAGTWRDFLFNITGVSTPAITVSNGGGGTIN